MYCMIPTGYINNIKLCSVTPSVSHTLKKQEIYIISFVCKVKYNWGTGA